jgi:Smg protein
MFDVLVYLFEHWFEAEACPDPDTLALKLRAADFDHESIHDALAWLGGLALDERTCLPESFADRASFRAYTPDEARRLNTECRGVIEYFEQIEVLNAEDRELVIDRALAVPEGDLDADDMKLIILIVLWAQGVELDTVVIEELLPSAETSSMH